MVVFKIKNNMKFNIQSEDYLIDKYTKIDNINSYNSSLLYGEVNYNDIYNIILISSNNIYFFSH